MSEDDVANVQAICAVSTQRAIELLEAGSGVVERAVDIHFQQNLNRSNGDSDGVVAIDDDDVVQVVSKKQTKEPAIVPPKKKQRKSPTKKQSSETSGKQSTLHSFLGIQKPKPSQSTINSFFTRKDVSKNNEQPDTPTSEPKQKTASPITPKDQKETNKKLEERKVLPATHSSDSREDAKVKPTQSGVNISKTITEKVNPPKTSPKPQPIQESASEEVDPRLSYATLAQALADTASTTKRNAKLTILKNVIVGVVQAVGGIHGDPTSRKTDAKTLTFALELMSGKIAPEEGYDMVIPPPLQVSGAAVSSAVMVVTGGVKRTRLREAYRATGDLGDVAAKFFTPAKSAKTFFLPRGKKEPTETSRDSFCTEDSASIEQIHTLLQSVASVPKGTGSQKQRHNILVKLLRLPKTKDEMRFLVRTLIDNMRLGATMKSILAALAMAFQEIQTGETSTPQDSAAIQTVQKTFDICPRINKIALFLLCGGIEKMVEECTLEVGTPIGPMLANPAHSLDEVKKLMAKGTSSTEESVSFSNVVVAEWKYDGVRCQAHYDGVNDRTKLFSRHLIDNSMQYPDACRYLLEARQHEKVTSFILDAEIVGVAKSEGKDEEWRLLPFQILSTRRGTKNADDNAVQVRVFAFDLMFLNGVSLLKNPLWERQKLLRENFNETSGFAFASCHEFATFEEQEVRAHGSCQVGGICTQNHSNCAPPLDNFVP
jgi:ATP-dependent DNA ligase I